MVSGMPAGVIHGHGTLEATRSMAACRRAAASAGQLGEAGVVHELTRVDRGDPGAPIDHFDDDVAGKQQADRRVELQGPVGDGGVAGAQDLEGWALHPELGLEGGGDVDLGEHPEALLGQRFADGGFGLLRGELHDGVNSLHG